MGSDGQRVVTDRAGLLTVLREDLAHHWGELSRPGFQALAVYRIRHRLRRQPPGPASAAADVLLRPLQGIVSRRFGIDIHPSAVLGRRLSVGHQGGIHIGPDVTMGDDCAILQGVRIGREDGDRVPGPTIGQRVHVGGRSQLHGEVHVGDDARIGPNAVVLVDVPPAATAVARPSKVQRAPAPVATPGAPTGTTGD